MAFQCKLIQNVRVFAPQPFIKIFLGHFISSTMISYDHDKLVDPGKIVPLTVDEGPSLPQLSISQFGKVRSIHLQKIW